MPRFSSGLACTHLISGVLLMHNVLPEAILYFETRRAHCTCIKYSKPCIGTHQRNLHLHGCGTDETDVHLTCQATLGVWKYNIAFLPVKGYRNVGNGTASNNKDSSGLSTFSYEERLRILDLPTLEYRRNRGDTIEVYKYLHGKYTVDATEILPRHQTTGMMMRGNALQLIKRSCHGQIKQMFF